MKDRTGRKARKKTEAATWWPLRKEEDTGYWNGKHQVALWRSGCGRRCGPVVRQTAEWMTVELKIISPW